MKKISIRELIEERKKYPVGVRGISEQKYISSKLNNHDDAAFLILPTGFLQTTKEDPLKKSIFKDRHLFAFLELSSIWKPYTNIQFSLLIFKRKAPQDTYFSRFFGANTFIAKHLSIRSMGQIGEQIIQDEYSHYLHKLEELIYSEQLPQSNTTAKFWKVKSVDFNINNLSAIYYEPELIENDKKLDSEKTEILQNLCEVLKPRSIKNEVGYIVKTKDFNYPLVTKKLSQGEITNIKLQRGDILFSDSFSGTQKFFLINETTFEPIYASSFLVVIRAISKVITPEYLFLYLQSETVKKYFLRNQSGGFFSRITLSKLRELPVIIPEEITQIKSKNIFETLFLQKRENLVEKINKELFDDAIPSKPIQKEFLVEELENLRVWKRDIIEKILRTDFSELEKCKQNKLYKSFLILSGSILEAFLLDWISEIENKNYFDLDEEEFTLGKLIWKKLKQAHPDVFDPELIRKASEIKDKRNLVHPKVYFNSLDKIDSKVCDEVLNDLREIFSKRK